MEIESSDDLKNAKNTPPSFVFLLNTQENMRIYIHCNTTQLGPIEPQLTDNLSSGRFLCDIAQTNRKGIPLLQYVFHKNMKKEDMQIYIHFSHFIGQASKAYRNVQI